MAVSSHFDFIIIGHGLAGLQLAIKMASDAYFNDKQIALIDPSPKNHNDKTWSFWELEPSSWGKLPYKTWHNAEVYTPSKHIQLKLAPYTYKSIKAIDFYEFAISKLKQKTNFFFSQDEVISISEELKTIVNTEKTKYSATHVFDSRIPKDYYKQHKYTTINQHFKGVVIRTNTDVFNPNTFTMMDYRLKDGNQTTFTYVLPFTKQEALVEFTYFTETKVDTAVYDRFISIYIKDFLKIDSYDIIDSEQGNIPMTTFPFYHYNTKNITKIGTGGGWVKPSTGYSFKHTEKKVAHIVNNIKAQKTPSANLFKRKYQFYDRVFLKVLKDENHKGEWIFQQFYHKNKCETMFRFLDEESTFLEELQIMWSLFSWSFIKAFFKTL